MKTTSINNPKTGTDAKGVRVLMNIEMPITVSTNPKHIGFLLTRNKLLLDALGGFGSKLFLPSLLLPANRNITLRLGMDFYNSCSLQVRDNSKSQEEIKSGNIRNIQNCSTPNLFGNIDGCIGMDNIVEIAHLIIVFPGFFPVMLFGNCI